MLKKILIITPQGDLMDFPIPEGFSENLYHIYMQYIIITHVKMGSAI